MWKLSLARPEAWVALLMVLVSVTVQNILKEILAQSKQKQNKTKKPRCMFGKN